MEATTTTRVHYDQASKEWVAEVGGPGRPVVRDRSKQVVEDFLDYLENRTANDSSSLASGPPVHPR